MTTTMTNDALKLQETVVELSGLVTAYSSLLEAAKQQLEQLEISESQFTRLETSVVNRVDYTRVANTLASNLQDMDRFADDSRYKAVLTRLIERLSERVSERLALDAVKVVEDKIDAALMSKSAEFRSYIQERIEERFDRESSAIRAAAEQQASDIKYSFRALLKAAYDSDELNRMAAAAVAEGGE